VHAYPGAQSELLAQLGVEQQMSRSGLKPPHPTSVPVGFAHFLYGSVVQSVEALHVWGCRTNA
jgi:hypothetical protein